MHDDAARKIEQLNAMLFAHEATHALLTDEINALEKQIDELDTSKELMMKQHEDEKAENDNTISEASDKNRKAHRRARIEERDAEGGRAGRTHLGIRGHHRGAR